MALSCSKRLSTLLTASNDDADDFFCYLNCLDSFKTNKKFKFYLKHIKIKIFVVF